MSLKLRDPRKLPNQGFYFQEAGRVFNEMLSFTGKAKLILIFRQDNNLARATLAEVSEDLENATCNQHPEICYDSNNISASSTNTGRTVTGCATCGGTPK